MTSEQNNVREWMQAFGQETPEKPIIPSLEVRKLRAKLILEEALETCKALGFDPDDGHLVDDMLDIATIVEPSLKEIADGCEDLKVVTEGTLVACGLVKTIYCDKMDKDPLFDEVMRSNWSKMWTTDEVNKRGVVTDGDSEAFDATAIIGQDTLGDEEGWTYKAVEGTNKWLVKDSNGKVIKSPSYSPANLEPIIEEMKK